MFYIKAQDNHSCWRFSWWADIKYEVSCPPAILISLHRKKNLLIESLHNNNDVNVRLIRISNDSSGDQSMWGKYAFVSKSLWWCSFVTQMRNLVLERQREERENYFYFMHWLSKRNYYLAFLTLSKSPALENSSIYTENWVLIYPCTCFFMCSHRAMPLPSAKRLGANICGNEVAVSQSSWTT